MPRLRARSHTGAAALAVLAVLAPPLVSCGGGDAPSAIDAGDTRDATQPDGGGAAARTWSAPARLAPSSEVIFAESFQTAMASGRAVVGWRQNLTMGGTDAIAVEYAVADDAWTEPTLLDTRMIDLRIALDGSGDALAAWRRFDGDFEVTSRRSPTRSGWLPAVVVADEANVAAHVGPLAMSAGGDALLPYTIAGDVHGMARLAAASGAWTAVDPLPASADHGDGHDLAMALDDDGDAVAVWRSRRDAASPDLAFSRSIAGGPWSSPALLEDGAAPIEEVHAAADADGDLVVAWLQAVDGEAASIWSRRFSSSTAAFDAAVEIDVDDAVASEPRIGAGVAGHSMIVWYQADASWVSAQVPGGDWSAPESLGTTLVRREVALDRDGDAVVLLSNPGLDGLFARHHDAAAATWGELITIAPPGTETRVVGLAMDGDGDAVATWLIDGDASDEVWGAAFRLPPADR